MNIRQAVVNHRNDQVVAAVDSGVIGTIFSMFTNEGMLNWLDGLGHFILFPLAAGLSFIRLGFAFRQAQLENYNRGIVVKTIVELVSTLAIATAVGGGIAGSILASTVFALASPIIFTAVLGAKALFHLGTAAYFLGKSNVPGIDNARKTRYRRTMVGHLKGAFILALSTVAVGLVMLAAQPIFAWLGLGAAVLGVGISVHNAYKAHRQANQLAQPVAPAPAHQLVLAPAPAMARRAPVRARAVASAPAQGVRARVVVPAPVRAVAPAPAPADAAATVRLVAPARARAAVAPSPIARRDYGNLLNQSPDLAPVRSPSTETTRHGLFTRRRAQIAPQAAPVKPSAFIL